MLDTPTRHALLRSSKPVGESTLPVMPFPWRILLCLTAVCVSALLHRGSPFLAFVLSTYCALTCDNAQLSSWAGLSPGNNERAGKRRSGKTTKGNKLLKTKMIQCAHSAVMVKSSYFCAQFQRISTRRGRKRADVAVAHSMLIAVYHMLKNGQVFSDLGADYYNQFNKERKVHHLADQNIEIDLDDGVKHNYELFADVLAKIK